MTKATMGAFGRRSDGVVLSGFVEVVAECSSGGSLRAGGLIRGSQVLNVACGGTLYQDIGKELTRKLPENERVVHMDYDNYDGHRHLVKVVENTPLQCWFKDSLGEEKMEILVNSYHHQGVKRLAQRFVPLAFAPDGLIEGFYDPDAYNPEEGKFIMGLQFHPERMRQPDSEEFDYPGCPSAYQEFVKAVIAYQKKLNRLTCLPKPLKLNKEMEKKRKIIVRSFSLAKDLYTAGNEMHPSKQPELEAGAEFLESNTALSVQQETRLKQMGATVRNGSRYIEKLKLNEERENLARNVMGKMSVEQLSDLMSFYHMMGQICSEILGSKLNEAWQHLQIQSDCTHAVNLMNDPGTAQSCMSIVRFIALLHQRSWDIELIWNRSKSNMVADGLSKLTGPQSFLVCPS
ncbi:hypothetical protein V6N11_010406 [Hibiscus sabdariffa]|uniref:Uncharacterized protein n=1 Tax=Hibiscus sabdariffa TaxID=183260 RepID=A0ABR2S572_9ROSI